MSDDENVIVVGKTVIENVTVVDKTQPGTHEAGRELPEQPRTQGTFWNESTLVDRGHVVSLYCPNFGQ